MEPPASRPAVFLDRDGVINESRRDYVKCWDEFRFLPGSLDALRFLASSRYLVVVVTNQSMVGRGIASRKALDSIHREMTARIASAGGRVDALYTCPHAPDDRCDCRKPAPGLFQQAARDLSIDFNRSVCIGDKLTDLIPGMDLGCTPVLVLSGEAGTEETVALPEIQVAQDLLAAVKLLLAGEAA